MYIGNSYGDCLTPRVTVQPLTIVRLISHEWFLASPLRATSQKKVQVLRLANPYFTHNNFHICVTLFPERDTGIHFSDACRTWMRAASPQLKYLYDDTGTLLTF